MKRLYTTGKYSALYPSDIGYLVTPTICTPATTKVIIGCHGRGGNGFNTVGSYPMEAHCTALVRAGYALFGVDHARINSWGDPDAMRALDDAYTYVTSTLGFSTTKVGLDGWSMGGATALNWAKRNASKVACMWLWNPVTDLRWFRDASGAYTPAYSNGSATQGAYTSEINTTFGPSSAAVGAYTIAALGGAGITMTITTNTGMSFADGSNSGVAGLPQATINARAFTYTSKTDSTLIGCVATTGSTIAVTNGMAITSSYAAQSNGYRMRDELVAYKGIFDGGVKGLICQCSDDVTVAPAMNNDATQGFKALVNSTNLTLRSSAPTGGHTNSIATVPASEVVAFFRANH